jgi:hypothetical protein
MNTLLSTRIRARRQRGQSMTEYVIVAGALAATLFAIGTPAGRMMTDAIRAFYASVTFLLSLP